MIVRPERAGDAEGIRSVICAAFGTARQAGRLPDSASDASADPPEADLVDWLRADEGWIPELALVGCRDDRILGYCLTTRAYVDDTPALGLGPIGVLPEHQGQGVARALIRQTILTAHAAGESLICLLGEPNLYSKFAFFDAARVGVLAPDPAWGAYFQALVLDPAHPRGSFRYAEPFGRL